METFGTVQDYADSREGISRQLVNYHISKGSIRRTPEKKISFSEADMVFINTGKITSDQILQNTPLSKPAAAPPATELQIPNFQILQGDKPESENSEPGEGATALTAFDKMQALTVARTRKTTAEAGIKELELAELDENLVRVADLSDELFKMFRKTRDIILAVPSRIPGLTHEQRETLKVELRAALEELSFG